MEPRLGSEAALLSAEAVPLTPSGVRPQRADTVASLYDQPITRQSPRVASAILARMRDEARAPQLLDFGCAGIDVGAHDVAPERTLKAR